MPSTQPNQSEFGYAFANGVLTVTYYIAANEAVVTSIADEASATSTVTAAAAGLIKVVTVITPNSAITSADDAGQGAVRATSAPFA